MQDKIVQTIEKVKTGELTPEECADKLFFLYCDMFGVCPEHNPQPVMGMDNVILEYRCTECGELC